jgi:hypothetical protein
MRGAIPPLSHYAFMARCLVKHRGSFTFTFTFPKHAMTWSRWGFKLVKRTELIRICISRYRRGSSVSAHAILRTGRPGFISRQGQ